MEIEIMVNDLLLKMLEVGIMATATYCYNPGGEIISFSVKITGYCE